MSVRVGGKPPSIPAHLLPPGSAAAAAVAAAAAAACVSSASSVTSSSSSISINSDGGVMTSKGVRTTATVPPMGLGTQHIPLTTTAGIRPPSPTSSSSFAAALRSLAKQATAPPGSEKEGSGEPQRMSPKVSVLAPSTTGHHGLSGGSVPPVVTIAPTHSHVTMTTEAGALGSPRHRGDGARLPALPSP
ncbi:hypothetical protein GWK47_023464 [Chionoecetes opilio]|uniref:Uncharacterized protein n=1 Tax=Chionoecetes opilio TaxID=41210 RepID=A0A8J5CJP5_CHIOP|nr:hypothetical protein GWK47_023464 [Chionoecetes opilio]